MQLTLSLLLLLFYFELPVLLSILTIPTTDSFSVIYNSPINTGSSSSSSSRSSSSRSSSTSSRSNNNDENCIIERRQSVLIPWKTKNSTMQDDDDNNNKEVITLGWALEERITYININNSINNKTSLNESSPSNKPVVGVGGKYYVSVGWGNSPGAAASVASSSSATDSKNIKFNHSDDVITAQLPYTTIKESLGSTLWLSSIAGSIVCLSPTLRDHMIKRKEQHQLDATTATTSSNNLIELGCGLGLNGIIAGKSFRMDNTYLTDNDHYIIELLNDLYNNTNNKNQSNDIDEDNTGAVSATSNTIQATYLEWRDSSSSTNNDNDDNKEIDLITTTSKYDLLIGADVAYYYYLLRPLIDTIRQCKPQNVLITGQANRQSLWDLYDAIHFGSYNQITDTNDPPWLGSSNMYLYKLQAGNWETITSPSENKTSMSMNTRDNSGGIIPIGVILYQATDNDDDSSSRTISNSRCAGRRRIETLSTTENDYIASRKDKDGLYLD